MKESILLSRLSDSAMVAVFCLVSTLMILNPGIIYADVFECKQCCKDKQETNGDSYKECFVKCGSLCIKKPAEGPTAEKIMAEARKKYPQACFYETVQCLDGCEKYYTSDSAQKCAEKCIEYYYQCK